MKKIPIYKKSKLFKQKNTHPQKKKPLLNKRKYRPLLRGKHATLKYPMLLRKVQ